MKKNVLDIGDYFEINIDNLKKALSYERADVKNIEGTIKYFKNNDISSFKAVVAENDGRVEFEQEFFNSKKEKIEAKAVFNESFILHLDSICDKEDFYYSTKNTDLNTPFNIKGRNFYNGDLFTFPLSAFEKYDETKFNDKFNKSIKNAINEGLTNIVFSINYRGENLKSAGDDLTDYFSNMDIEKYDYSSFNAIKKPIIRLFLTNNLGNSHFSLNDLVEENEKYLDSNERVENLFFGEPAQRKYNGKMISSMSQLKENTLILMLNVPQVEENLEIIGNFDDKESNFISSYDMLNHFKKHQINKMDLLTDIKAIRIKKEDLSELESNLLEKDSTHIVLLPIKNEIDGRYIDLIKVEAIKNKESYKYGEEKEYISLERFNDIIEKSKNKEIIKENQNFIEVESEYETNRKIDKSKSLILNNIEKNFAYVIPVDELVKTVKDLKVKEQLEILKRLDVKNCIMNISSPHYFLLSDSYFENNNDIFIDRSRFLETRIYPIDNKNNKYIDIELLSLIEKNDIENSFKVNFANDKKIECKSNVHSNYISSNNIKLNTNDTLNIIKDSAKNMFLIEERQNPFFEMANVLDDYILRMYSRKINEKILENDQSKKISKKNKP